MTQGVAVWGAGGHAKVVVELLEYSGARIAGVYSDALAEHGRTCADQRVRGGREALRDDGVRRAIVAIGDNRARLRIGGELTAVGLLLHTGIHPAASIARSARIGCGVVIVAGAVVNADAIIGDACIINTLAGVDHDCHLAAGVHVAPGAHLCGGVVVGKGALIGAGATVIPGRSIGVGAVVGAGATVVHDVPEGAVVVGTPARCVRGET